MMYYQAGGVLMGLIKKVAYLNMCECGQHGKIILADGTEQPEFCSKKAAHDMLGRLYKEKQLTDLELKFLHDQISNMSDLPPKDGDINLFDLMACDMLMEIKRSLECPREGNPKYVM